MAPAAHHCHDCGARLARDNKGERCSECIAKARNLRFRPPEVPATFWEHPTMRKALAARHIGRVIHAYRHHPHHGHRAIPQGIVAGWLNVHQTLISRKEKGPAPQDLNFLSAVARTLRIPDHLLWFRPQPQESRTPSPQTAPGLTSGAKDVADAHAIKGSPLTLESAPHFPMGVADSPGRTDAPLGTVEETTYIAVDWGEMERRHVLQLGVLTGLSSLVPSEHKLHDLADLLSNGEPRTIEEWFTACADHLHAIRTRSPSEARDQILIDLLALQQQLHTTGNGDVRELHQVHAALSTLLANSLTRLGEHGPALRWWRTARHAADICGDPDMRMLVRGSEAGFGLYGQRSPETVLHLTHAARRIDGAQPAELAQVVSTEAKALSLMGRHDEAKQRLRELEGFSLGDSVDSPIPTYWKSDQVHFAQSWVYAAAGDETHTDTAGNLVLAAAGDYQYVANVQLHQALCTVVNGGIDTGVKEATAVLDALPETHRSHMITEVGKKILRAVPLDQHRRGTVKDFQAVLTATAPSTAQAR